MVLWSDTGGSCLLSMIGQDYDEVFCLVVSFESIRMVVALAIQNGLKLHQMDVATAFFNVEL